MKYYKKLLIFVFILVMFLAIMDIFGARVLWASVGGFSSETYLKIEPLYMIMFWAFALMLGISASITYYIIKKDKTESAGILSFYLFLIISGWEDLFYYLFQLMPLDKNMSWLNNNGFIYGITKIMGYSNVNPITLITSAIVGLIFGLSMALFLKEV